MPAVLSSLCGVCVTPTDKAEVPTLLLSSEGVVAILHPPLPASSLPLNLFRIYSGRENLKEYQCLVYPHWPRLLTEAVGRLGPAGLQNTKEDTLCLTLLYFLPVPCPQPIAPGILPPQAAILEGTLTTFYGATLKPAEGEAKACEEDQHSSGLIQSEALQPC